MITYGEVLIIVFGVVASIQFTNPIIRFRLKVFLGGWGWYGLLVCFIFIVMGSFIINAFLFGTQKDFWNIVVGFLCAVVFAPVVIVSRPIKYSRWNSRKYVQECNRIIISRESKDLISLLNEIDVSIDIITKNYVKQINTSDIEKLFSLLAEPHICKTLVGQFPELLYKFIQQLLKTNFNEMHEKLIAKSSMRRFLLEIITQAILNENSIFYKDYLHSELGDKNTFISLIFGNAEFIQSHFTPLLSLNERCHSPLSEAQFNLYTQIQEIILDKYLGCHDAFRNKDCAMRPLLGLINSESVVISQDTGLESLTTLNYIWKVQDYLQINVIWKQLEEIVTQENPKFPFEQELTDMLTKLLFKHFLTLSKIKVRNDRFGSILESFWMFLNARYTEGSMGSKIQEKFEERIFRHLNNMHPIDPRITGCLINSLLMTYIYHNSIDNRWKTLPVMASLHHLPKSPIMNTWSGKFSEKFAQFLRENFGKTAPFELDDFLKRLPENIRYDATNHILYFVPFGREQEESFSLYDHENQPNIQT